MSILSEPPEEAMSNGRDRAATLKALLHEGMDDIDRGDVVDMTADFWTTLNREADEEDRLGVPIPEHVRP